MRLGRKKSPDCKNNDTERDFPCHQCQDILYTLYTRPCCSQPKWPAVPKQKSSYLSYFWCWVSFLSVSRNCAYSSDFGFDFGYWCMLNCAWCLHPNKNTASHPVRLSCYRSFYNWPRFWHLSVIHISQVQKQTYSDWSRTHIHTNKHGVYWARD